MDPVLERANFGQKDPTFHRDIGFYVFKLPFLQFIAGWTFAALLVILIVTLVFHYLNGGIAARHRSSGSRRR